MAVVLWTLVGLFWVGVAANAYINKSETRKAWRKRVTDKVAFAIFDVVEWVRVKVFRRKPSRPSEEELEARILVMLHEAGVRATFVTDPNGERQLMFHQEDKANLDAFLEKASR